MQNIMINENIYRVQREFIGQRSVKGAIIESIKNNPRQKVRTLTEVVVKMIGERKMTVRYIAGVII